jgi:hypothetical protein
VAAARLDLSGLGTADLQALRLGFQVMRHKAELAARPRVEAWFARLLLTLDSEEALRRRVPDGGPLVSVSALPVLAADLAAAPGARAEAVAGTAGPEENASPAEDRRVTLDYLDLLLANDRLAPGVRQVIRTIRDQFTPIS